MLATPERWCRKPVTSSLKMRLLQRPGFLIGLFFLLFDILSDCCFIYVPNRGHVIPTSPEIPLEFVSQFWMFVEDHQCRLPFHVSHEFGYGQLRRYTQAQMHVVRTYRSFDDFDLLVSAQCKFQPIGTPIPKLTEHSFRSERYVYSGLNGTPSSW